jgi:ribosomal protein S18 acetylase RimI-like enzyme
MISRGISNRQILRLEELSLNSWPALRSLLYDGWILRLANGLTDRSNSVWPLYGSNLELEEKIHRCERFYTGQSQPAIFRITSDDSRSQLDDFLEKRGYTVKTPTIVQTRRIVDLSLDLGSAEVSIDNVPDESWVTDVVDVAGFSGSASTYLGILRNISLPLALARTGRDGRVIALGLSVVEDNFLGLYGMNTRLSHRRQGWARRLFCAMLKWGRDQGAETAYLHVEADNSPARRLYESMGFNEVYRYWYRVKPDVYVKAARRNTGRTPFDGTLP